MEPVWSALRRRDQAEESKGSAGLAAVAMAPGRNFCEDRGETFYLWRAVDHEGEVLEAFVTRKRDKKSALKFLRKAMKRYGQPKTIVTDKLRSYRAALKEVGLEARQETRRWLNNRAENSHLPFRRRERAMQRFRQMRTLQRFTAIHSSVTTTSTRTVISTAATFSRKTALPLSRSGGSFAPPESAQIQRLRNPFMLV